MSTIEHGNDAGLDDFLAKWDLAKPETVELVRGGMAVIGLTNFGEHPVQSTRLAEVLGRPASEAEALTRQWGWPGTRVEDGLITVNPERAQSAAAGVACSFCGKPRDAGLRLVAGPSVYSCAECVRLCNEILAQDAVGGDGPAGESRAWSGHRLVPPSSAMARSSMSSTRSRSEPQSSRRSSRKPMMVTTSAHGW
jgi:ClpX C4-type zinc finger